MRPIHFSIRRPARAAFTLIELLVVIAIIVVLAGVLTPVLSSVQENGRSTKCVSNLRQISAATDLYVNDNNGYLPALQNSSGVAWDSAALAPYLPARNTAGTTSTRQSVLFICPDAKYTGFVNSDLSRTYSATECMRGPSGAITDPSNRTTFASMTGTLFLFDGIQQSTTLRYSRDIVTWANISGVNDLHDSNSKCTYIDYRHRNAFHGLFADGHVDTIFRKNAKTTVTQLMWTGRVSQ